MKKRTIIDLVIMAILTIVLIFLGNIDYTKGANEDNKRFDKEYNLVDSDNIFKYVEEDETYEIISGKKDGIIFMGFSENKWSNYYAKILNESAKENEINEIYYYNFKEDRAKESKIYLKIVEELKNFLKQNDEGKVNIAAPCLVMVKNGYVIGYDDETSVINGTMTPKTYWNEQNVENKKLQFNNLFKLYVGGIEDGGSN